MSDFEAHVDDRVLAADWLDVNGETRERLRDAFPIEGEAARWGDELYATVDVEASPTTTDTAVTPGTIAYWPDGPAICLFWGPTPASTDDTPVAASPVGPVARIDDIDPLADVDGGAPLGLAEPDD